MVSTLAIAMAEQPVDRVAALFDAHHHRLYRLARRLTRSADEALDLVQETFLRAARAPRSVPLGADREEAWLVRVLDAWQPPLPVKAAIGFDEKRRWLVVVAPAFRESYSK